MYYLQYLYIVLFASGVTEILHDRSKRRKTLDCITKSFAWSKSDMLRMTERSLNCTVTASSSTKITSSGYWRWPERHQTIRYPTTVDLSWIINKKELFCYTVSISDRVTDQPISPFFTYVLLTFLLLCIKTYIRTEWRKTNHQYVVAVP